MNLFVLAIDGVFDSGLSCLLDAMAFANNLRLHIDPALAPFAVTLIGPRRQVVTHHGMRVTVAPLNQLAAPGILLVPALFAADAADLEGRLDTAHGRAAQNAIRAASAAGLLVAGACTGTFLLAAAGCLDGRRATTAWWLSNRFKTLFPHVQLDADAMVVAAGSFVTAGAALAHLDLALWLVRQRSLAWADLTARYLVSDARVSQASYMLASQLAHDDELVRRFESDARARLNAPFSLATTARRLGASERSLQRRVQAALGRSPLAFLQDIRVERAVHLLRTENMSMAEIAQRVGYANAVTLRNLIRKKTGQTSVALRHRA